MQNEERSIERPTSSLNEKRQRLKNEILDVISRSVNLHIPDRGAVLEAWPLTRDGHSAGLGLDSVDILEVVVSIESHFKIKVGNAEQGRRYFATVGSIIDFVLHSQK